MTIAGVDKLGDALDVNGIVSQVTTGGTFFLYDDSNFLLLSGGFTGGVVVGSVSDSAGSFFTTSPLMYTGGSLLPLIIPGFGKAQSELHGRPRPAGVRAWWSMAGTWPTSRPSPREVWRHPPFRSHRLSGWLRLASLLMVRHHRRRRRVASTA